MRNCLPTEVFTYAKQWLIAFMLLFWNLNIFHKDIIKQKYFQVLPYILDTKNKGMTLPHQACCHHPLINSLVSHNNL